MGEDVDFSWWAAAGTLEWTDGVHSIPFSPALAGCCWQTRGLMWPLPERSNRCESFILLVSLSPDTSLYQSLCTCVCANVCVFVLYSFTIHQNTHKKICWQLLKLYGILFSQSSRQVQYKLLLVKQLHLYIYIVTACVVFSCSDWISQCFWLNKN